MSPRDMKALQRQRIAELTAALAASGIRSLDQQARALGIPRSTAWTIQRAEHKGSGLTAGIVNRMLGADLPPAARAILLHYIGEKAAGAYGQKPAQCRRFRAKLSQPNPTNGE